jgi:hypothetical protein
MPKNKLRVLAAACAGAVMLAATPAAAMTTYIFYSGPFIAGYIIYANDGHICAQSGNTLGMPVITHYPQQDC